MLIINKDETRKWLQNKNIIDPGGDLIFSRHLQPLEYKIPSDSGRKTALSGFIVSKLCHEDESLLWINEFGIWPSSEDWNLFERFRESLGEKEPLNEKPGHIIEKNDYANFKSLLSLILYFYWGAILVPASKQFLFQISHDEYLYFYHQTPKGLSDFQIELENFAN